MKTLKQNKKSKIITIIILFVVSIFLIILFSYAGKLLYPLKYQDLIKTYSEQYQLDPYLVSAVIKVESSFRPEAVSHKNARGLMQITDRTGKWGSEKLQLQNFDSEDLYRPEINIQIGCWYLSRLYQEFGDTELVLAAYNGGSGNVTQWLKDSQFSSNGKSLDRIPFKETDRYVKKVKNSYVIYKRLYENEF